MPQTDASRLQQSRRKVKLIVALRSQPRIFVPRLGKEEGKPSHV